MSPRLDVRPALASLLSTLRALRPRPAAAPPPAPTALGDILAYRPDAEQTAAELWTPLREPVRRFLLSALGGTLGVHLIGALPLFWAWLGALGVGLLLAAAYYWRATELRVGRLGAALLLPPLLVLPASVLATNGLAQRGLAGLLLTGLALIFLCGVWCAAHPFAFWRDWLACAPWLRPERREAVRAGVGVPVRRWLRQSSLVVLTLGCVVGLGGISTRGATLVLFLIGLAYTDFRPWRVYRELREVLAHALTYDIRDPQVVGVWRPAASLRARRWFLGVTLVLVHLALSTGLTLYLPTQLLVPTTTVSLPVPTPTKAPPRSPAPTPSRRPSPAPLRTPSPAPTLAASLPLQATPDTYAGLRAFALTTWNHRQLTPQGFFDFVLYPLFCGLVLPLLLILAVWRGYLLEAEALLDWLATLDDPDGRSVWQWWVDRLGGVATEDPFLWLGYNYSLRAPILIRQSMLRGHVYICGTTGGNKTSIGIVGLLLQVLVGQLAQVPILPLPPPVIIIDLKGDMAMLQTIQARAAANGQTFRFFTPEHLRATHHFLPFATLQKAWRTPIQLCQLVLEALGKDYGSGYGRSYFTGVARAALLQALQHPSQPATFADLYQVLTRLRRGSALQDCLELLHAIEALAQYPQLGPHPDPELMIDFHRVLEQREVVYFWLPMTEPMASREIAKLALFALFTAAQDRQRTGQPLTPTYLVVDEFQRVVSRDLDLILQQARSFGIAAILANQSVQDLKTPDADLRALIKTCTRVQLYFTVTEYEARALSELAGKETVWLQSVGESTTRLRWRAQRSRTISALEARQERLPVEQIMTVSSDPEGMIAYFGLDTSPLRYGGRPVLVRTLYPLRESVYQAALQADWPTLPSQTTAPSTPSTGVNATPSPAPSAAAPTAAAEQIEALLAAQLAA